MQGSLVNTMVKLILQKCEHPWKLLHEQHVAQYTVHVRNQNFATHLEDLKTSNVKHTNEEGTSILGCQCLIDSFDKPQEHPFIDAFAEGTNGVVHLTWKIKMAF